MSPHSVFLDGCELYYERAGSGPPVLLVHGAGAYAGLLAPCLDALTATHDVVAYDRRGLSRSRHATVRDLDVHVSDATALIRECFDGPATVVGWSAGAMIALRLALQHPQAVSALVLAEPPVQRGAPDPGALGALLRWELKRLTAGPEAAARIFYRWVSQYPGAGGNAFDGYPAEWREQMLANAEALFAEIRAVRKAPRDAQLAALELPIQVLLGTRSASVFEPGARHLVSVIASAQLVSVPDASHMIPTDRPDVVAEAVRRVGP